ncbi:MAG: hypothetical protein KDA46_07770 [Parvularculaceae bacterium]|nr:hypothetical protein [Parvularculaceae bacterium]
MNAKPKPFDFDDLHGASDPQADAAPAIVLSDEDIDAARADGVAEGRRLAMQTLAAEDAAALTRLAELLDAGAARHEQMLAAERAAMRNITAEFLREMCAALYAERELEIAADMLKRLTENSDDRRPARLAVSERAMARQGKRLSALIADRGVGDFVTLNADPALAPGEARLDWRGGGVRRSHEEIRAAVTAVIEAINALEKEPQK